ncbi:MAG TPA: AMP-binding protein [Candidatus Gallibacteroides avistercoris]|uniref:AMP-binding protein n=1 Tax=Candidatus Gallibacteroides avistercoris TaxID=2840833 RepID=A0A9D1M8C4_9BACT|nr:AMP-binding protein [Candidatus Gallibacteroides avistercoris]
MIQQNFIKLYEASFRENWDLPALTDYNEKRTFLYKEMAVEIAKLHLLFRHCQVRRGDKIALIGKNTPRWCMAFMSVVTYGAIVVPILQDFHPNDVQHIINHSEAVMLFAGDHIWENLEEEKLPQLRGILSLSDYSCFCQRDGEDIAQYLSDMDAHFRDAYPAGFTQNDVQYARLDNDKIIELNYTSGTTGFTKGVMLTGNNLGGNVVFGMESQLHYKGSRCLSFLPLAHAFGCAFDFLTPMAVGTHVILLGKIPSPKILLKAFEEVKPNLILTVPLVLEKIYRKQISPMLNKLPLKLALNVPLLDGKIYGQIRKKLVDAFGGRFAQVIVGGAPLNPEVEAFLTKIKFPFTVGYGMTECAPLISYTHYTEFVPGSAGRILPRIMEIRVDSPDPENISGEIWVRGENVMKGYYKNPEATALVLDSDGWLHTGDMGTVTADGTIFIRGRVKSMILGSNGQNIYPEEIEAKLNNMPFIMESLVKEKNGKLIALVYPDYEAVDSYGISNEDLPVALEEVRQNLNKNVSPYEQITAIQLYPTEFEKTPKKSIKRYLYDR